MYEPQFFIPAEFECRCGCGRRPTDDALKRIDKVREIFGQPLVMTSGARCPSYNAKVGGASASKHVEGIAFDLLKPIEKQLALLLLIAGSEGFRGVGIYSSFIHLDMGSLRSW